MGGRWRLTVGLILLGMGVLGGGVGTWAQPLEPLGAFYRADLPFPEYLPFWRDTTAPQDLAGGVEVGGSLHVLLRNKGATPLGVEDVLLEGISLRRAIAFSQETRKQGLHPASLLFSNLPPEQRERLVALGEPVWWRVEPPSIPAQGAGEVFVRLRRRPPVESLRLEVQTSVGSFPFFVPIRTDEPRLEGVFFSPNLDRVYLYPHRLKGTNSRPVRVWMDGGDVTARASMGYDEAVRVTPIVLDLEKPLAPLSFHCFQVAYEDGAMASAGLRAWGDEFAYGMWGARPAREGDFETARRYLQDLHDHNINVQMEMIGSPGVQDFLKSEEGQRLLETLGLRLMVNRIGKYNVKRPFAYFLVDEPDCGDYRVESLPPERRIGSLAQALVERSRELRAGDSLTPHLLNVNMTYKPDNWYIYGQLPDIFAADPYYQERLRSAYLEHPERLALYVKPTYVYAVGRICQSACAPKPLHLILNSVHHIEPGQPFRYATPEEKRVEVYYALAAGAKGISYWWYTPVPPFVGVGADEPQAKALWEEIGRLGREVRAVGPVLMRGCPAALSLQAPRRLWVRTLLAGLDTLVVICVNEDHANDRWGTVVRPLEEVKVTLRLPAWLKPRRALEVTPQGFQEVAWEQQGSEVTLNLGTVHLTRLLLLTSSSSGRSP